MLATTAERPFTHRDWLFELKYDGFRLWRPRKAGGCASSTAAAPTSPTCSPISRAR
jgi:hypothetical protein